MPLNFRTVTCTFRDGSCSTQHRRAPTFFPPEEITLNNQKFLFVDGGITPYNNPGLLAVMMATLPCFRLNWPQAGTRFT